MEYICTVCSREKREGEGAQPAIERYADPRIKKVYNISRASSKPMVILSGKYGLISPNTKILWYDKKLESEDIERLLPIVKKQAQKMGISRLHFYETSSSNSDWEPYIKLLRLCCEQLNIPLESYKIEKDL